MNSLLEKVNELKFFLEGSNPGVNVKVSKSNISGVGLFTTKSLKEGDIIGISHINSKEGWQPRSPLGRYYNHSDAPNCVVKTVGTINLLKSNSLIPTNEELTVDYRKQPYLEQPGEWALAEGKGKIPSDNPLQDHHPIKRKRSGKPMSKEEHKRKHAERPSDWNQKPDPPEKPDDPEYTVS